MSVGSEQVVPVVSIALSRVYSACMGTGREDLFCRFMIFLNFSV